MHSPTPTHTRPKKGDTHPKRVPPAQKRSYSPASSQKKVIPTNTHPHPAKKGHTHSHPPTPSQKKCHKHSHPPTTTPKKVSSTHTQPKKVTPTHNQLKNGHTQPKKGHTHPHVTERKNVKCLTHVIYV